MTPPDAAVSRGTVQITTCNELKGKVIPADKACACCSNTAAKAAARVAQLLLSLISQTIRSGQLGGTPGDTPDVVVEVGAPVGGLVELAPGKITVPRVGEPNIRGLPRGAPAAAGTVILILGEVAFLLAQDVAALNALQTLADAIPSLVSVTTRTARGWCLECVAEAVLPQSSRRKRQTVRYPKRK